MPIAPTNRSYRAQISFIIRIPTGRRQTSWLFTKRDRGFELGATEKQIQVVVRGEHEPGTTGLRVQHTDHSTTLPPRSNRSHKSFLSCPDIVVTVPTNRSYRAQISLCEIYMK